MVPVTHNTLPASAYHGLAQQLWAYTAIPRTGFPQAALGLISGHKNYIQTYKGLGCLDLQ